MKRLIAAAVVMAALGGTSLHAQTQAPRPEETITPGLWEYKTKMAGITVDSEKRCVTGPEIDKFFDGPCNRHHTCRYDTKQVADGKAKFVGYWLNKEGKRTNVTAEGTYSPKRFTLKARALGLGATLDAQWVAASCAGATKK